MGTPTRAGLYHDDRRLVPTNVRVTDTLRDREASAIEAIKRFQARRAAD